MSGRLWRAGRWLLGIAIVALLVLTLDPAALVGRLADADLRLAVLGIIGLTAVHLIPAETWRILCRRLGGVRLPWRGSVTAYYAAQALGGVTPANLGGDVYRVHALRSAGNGFDAAVAPVVVQRATSYLALSLLGGVALIFVAAGSAVSPFLVVPAAALALLGAVVAGLLLIGGGPFERLRRKLGDLLGAGLNASPGTDGTGRIAGGAGIGLALGIVFHGVSVLLTAVLVAAINPDAVSLASIAALAVARLTLAIPISPSGLGFQEGALSALFIAIGLPPETALAALLLGRISLLTTTLVGAIALGVQRPVLAAPGHRSPDPVQ
jgi:uncharacterized membrane protein YbhN (UPF0104 family)